MSGESDLVDLDLDLIHQTDRAFLVSDGNAKVWLPKSAVEYEEKKPGHGTFTMPEKLAADKGLV